MLIIRLICAAYCSLLTLMLLLSDPLALLGIKRAAGISQGWGVHFWCFAVLGLLALASRFPIRSAVLAGGLVGYAVATELLQGFVPLRAVERGDLIENLLGLTAAGAVWWVVQKCILRGSQETR